MIRCLIFLSLLLLQLHSTQAQKASDEASTKWLTLSGARPMVIARGGFSGLFPESSGFANQMAVATALTDMAMSCNLQLTKDGVGLCLPDVRMDNSTTISMFYPNAQKTYKLNGQTYRGWFTFDFTSEQLLNNITLTQSIYSRSNLFDGQLPIATVDDVVGIKPPKFWLSVPYDSFYNEHKLSPAMYIEQSSRLIAINYISSPEIGFLKTMGPKVNKLKTKLVFQFLAPDLIEPSTKTKYGSILESLASVKSYASGILVPKEFIWPVGPDGYLGSPTTLVADAHKLGLEVYASGFSNDVPASYNYTYDPSSEYLQFVDNSQFSVDGVLTDFPPTASEAIACFAHNNAGSKPRKANPLVISHNGASGVYPGCTDMAYQQAVDDGADIIDCSVQLSKDGVAFCLAGPDLAGDTTAMMPFIDRKDTIPEIQQEIGVFSFALTWTEIQSLKPQLVSPFANSSLLRSPAHKNSGKLLTLAEFLDFAKAKAVSGILINIENAAYLAEKQGLDLVGTVVTALSNATFDKQSTQQVLIQSDDTSVLSAFKDFSAYKRVLRIKERFGDAPRPSVEEITKHAQGVTLSRSAVVRVSDSFTLGITNVVKELKAANLSVYVHELRNEYITLALDYFSDPIVELATYVHAARLDGFITDYPGTASKYLRSPCAGANPTDEMPYPIFAVDPGSLISLVPAEAQPPAPAPVAALEVDDIVDPPLPAVAKINRSKANDTPPAKPSGAMPNVANVGLSLVMMMLLQAFLSMGC